MYWLYNICLVGYWLFLVPVLLYRLVFEDGFYDRLKQSAGIMPQPTLEKIYGSNGIWVHAASVGEIVAASPVVRELKRRYPHETVVVSVVTATGHRMAQRIIPEADGHIFFPVDLPIITARIVDIVKPKVILLVETELWPNFLRLAEKRGFPVMMVNGRISDRSARRYALIRRFTRRMLAQIKWFCMQSEQDAEYIIQMGASPAHVEITGNTKYDQTYAEVSSEEKEVLCREFAVGHRHPVIVAGSVHKGEDELVLDMFDRVRQQYPEAFLIIAPREIPRSGQVADLAAAHGYRVQRRTQATAAPTTDLDVLILDTIGELGRIYSLADVVVVGGSFVPVGGHNILEPAAHGKPILVGPYMFNFKEIYTLMESHDAVVMTSEAQLSQEIIALLADTRRLEQLGAHALRLIQENGGATRRNVDAFAALAKREGIQWQGAER